jgi:hypothetical protein
VRALKLSLPKSFRNSDVNNITGIQVRDPIAPGLRGDGSHKGCQSTLKDHPRSSAPSSPRSSRHKVSIGFFKKECDDLKVTLIGAGIPAMDAAQDAMEYLSKLDLAHYGEKFTSLTNCARLGEDFP